MLEFAYEVIRPVNFPATMLLGMVFIYWMMVILGALGVDSLDLDADLDADASPSGGPWMALFKFFHLGDVPITLFISVFAFSYWFITIVCNHYINPEWSWLVAFYCFVPCLILSLALTKLVVAPTAPFFRKLNAEGNQNTNLLGKLAMVSTSEVTDSFGQVSIQQEGPPIVLNVRCHGARLIKGEIVELISYDTESNTYLVRLAK
jgi:hypothetical protein